MKRKFENSQLKGPTKQLMEVCTAENVVSAPSSSSPYAPLLSISLLKPLCLFSSPLRFSPQHSSRLCDLTTGASESSQYHGQKELLRP